MTERDGFCPHCAMEWEDCTCPRGMAEKRRSGWDGLPAPHRLETLTETGDYSPPFLSAAVVRKALNGVQDYATDEVARLEAKVTEMAKDLETVRAWHCSIDRRVARRLNCIEKEVFPQPAEEDEDEARIRALEKAVFKLHRLLYAFNAVTPSETIRKADKVLRDLGLTVSQ